MDYLYIEFNCEGRDFTQALGFDLDDTLTVWKKNAYVFPKELIVDKLRGDKLIVIFTNQYRSNEDYLIDKFTGIAQDLQLPMVFFASLKKDRYRKPILGMYDVYFNKYGIALEFYCGDAAGRQGDFSDTDLKFAINIKTKFILPETFFLGERVKIPPIKGFDPRDVEVCRKKYTFPRLDEIELVIMVGFPGSGKTTIAENIPYEYISGDKLKTLDRALKSITKFLSMNKSVVYDATNLSSENRKKCVELAGKFDARCTCLHILTPEERCKHNNLFRNYISDGEYDLVPEIAYRTMKARYQVPRDDEGFDRIINVDFCINMDIPKEIYYRYYF